MKFALFAFAFLCFSGCGDWYNNSPGNQYTQSTTRINNSTGLPSNPAPNKCYVRVITQPEYKVFVKSYLTYTEADAEKYPHRVQTIETYPAYSRWEYTTYDDCTSPDPTDCQVLSFREYDAAHKTIFVPEDSTLGNPAFVDIEIQELIAESRLASWEEIECELTSYQILPIRFTADKLALTEEDGLVLKSRLIPLLQDRPNITIEISTHTDARGDADKNLEITQIQVQAIEEYLVAQSGVSVRRIVTRAFGEARLKNHCKDGINCSDAEHDENSRVEFRVLNVNVN